MIILISFDYRYRQSGKIIIIIISQIICRLWLNFHRRKVINHVLCRVFLLFLNFCFSPPPSQKPSIWSGALFCAIPIYFSISPFRRPYSAYHNDLHHRLQLLLQPLRGESKKRMLLNPGQSLSPPSPEPPAVYISPLQISSISIVYLASI